MSDPKEQSFSLNTTIQKFPQNNLGYHWYIQVPDFVADAVYFNNARRVQMHIREVGPIPVGIMKTKDFYYILMSKDLIKKCNLDDQTTVTVILRGDKSLLAMPLPEEFAVIFDIDEEAREFFYKLTPGTQRILIHLVDKIKSEILRAEKSWVIAEHLKANKGKLDYKMLNVAFRNAK